MESKNTIILLAIIFAAIFVALNAFLINEIFFNRAEAHAQYQNNDAYNPQINPQDFVSRVDNKYFTLTPGKKFIYEGKTAEGIERTEVYATGARKKVFGVNTIVVRDRVWLDDELVEDTSDWYAQDKYGNVWYFGEDSKDYEDGKLVSTKGSWEAGIDGAKPGIVMKAYPKIGETYRQEYYNGKAEDMGEVVSLGVKIKVQYGEFTDCLQTRDWNPLEPGSDEYKYYCPEVGNLVYEVGIENGEQSQLIDIDNENA